MERFKAAWRELSIAQREALADVIGAGRRYLDNVVLDSQAHRQLSPKVCVGIERAFEGRITCEELAPAEPWRRVKDRSWPNKAGRPLVDYAQRVEA